MEVKKRIVKVRKRLKEMNESEDNNEDNECK